MVEDRTHQEYTDPSGVESVRFSSQPDASENSHSFSGDELPPVNQSPFRSDSAEMAGAGPPRESCGHRRRENSKK